MANNDQSSYTVRFNEISSTLEYAAGLNWVTVPGVGSSITASEINSEAATDGQVLTADGAGGATWEDAPGGTPGGNNQNVQFKNGTAFDGNDSFNFDGTIVQAPQVKALVFNAAQAGDPAIPVEGDIWYNTVTHTMRGCTNLGTLYTFDVTND